MRKEFGMKIALTRVTFFESIAPSNNGRAQDGERQKKKGGLYDLDNRANPVCLMASGVFCVPRRRRPYPPSSGHCHYRCDRTTITGPESSLAEKTPICGYRRHPHLCLSVSGGYSLEEGLTGSPSSDLI